MNIKITDEDYLKSIFYNVYDIESVGLVPQMHLVETLTRGGRVAYETEAPQHSASALMPADHGSNLLTNTTVVAKIFDPSIYTEDFVAHLAPPDYLGEDSERLRAMKRDLDAKSRTGRSFMLRSIAGLYADLNQPELTDDEASEISGRLAEKYGLNASPFLCLSFVTGYNELVNMSKTAEETDCQRTRTLEIIYDFCNGDGRRERAEYHAAKLDLMNVILDSAIRKSRSVGIDPDTFRRQNTKTDINYADRFREAFGEEIPTPDVLLARSRDAVNAARIKYGK